MMLLCGLLSADPAAVDTWPAFRGDGTSHTAARNLPLRWSGTENLAWRIGLPGYGQSSPIVWKDRVFVTAAEGPEKEKCIVLAADLKSGKTLWRKDFEASQKCAVDPSMSRAAPTPVADAEGIYVFFESGDLVGLTHDGRVRWQRSLVKDFGEIKTFHGLGGSLAQTDAAIFVLVEQWGQPSYLLAVEKKSGRELWKVERAQALSWTTPVIVPLDGKPVVLVSSNSSLACYDAATGRELWTHKGLVGNLIPSPVVADGMVLVGAGEGGPGMDLRAVARSNCCLRLTNKEGKPGCELVWQGKKAVLYYASPIVHRGFVYQVTRVGILYCLDAATGEEKYVQRLNNICWATPVAAGEHLYFFGKDGKTTVIEAGPQYRVVTINRLWSDEEHAARRTAAEKAPESQLPPLPEQGKAELEVMLKEIVGDIVYGVAVVDGTFLIRTGTELYCVRAGK
jgi:outer membrane protein assembly factor BamB